MEPVLRLVDDWGGGWLWDNRFWYREKLSSHRIHSKVTKFICIIVIFIVGRCLVVLWLLQCSLCMLLHERSTDFSWISFELVEEWRFLLISVAFMRKTIPGTIIILSVVVYVPIAIGLWVTVCTERSQLTFNACHCSAALIVFSTIAIIGRHSVHRF